MPLMPVFPLMPILPLVPLMPLAPIVQLVSIMPIIWLMAARPASRRLDRGQRLVGQVGGEAVAAGAAAPGLLQRDVGRRDHMLRRLAVQRVERDADAGADAPA